ncbi:MAG: T9SS type A sorting domain-containing protein [Candidatus Cloacimonetes bacterium]|nr:T9SS type A sorting domain-containing protein [Candidatus Cloacimonadota bacterium]MCF7814439.1 T9SS type A sorting domain-containing protein [Candidatus Cloacimonadota bacterium]MCF7868789.1 T9SS type A sorting domain-containing protein [Candidatus Cloacimonadota bacterium]
MKKNLVFLLFTFLLFQICFGNPPPVNNPDRLGVSMIGSYVRDYGDYTEVTGTFYPNVLPLTCTGYNVQGFLPENVTLTSIESLYYWGEDSSYWPACEFGLTSPHSFTATFNTSSYYAVNPGQGTLEIWADYDDYHAQIDAMITVTVPGIDYYWPQDPASPGSTISREIYTMNVPASATLPCPYTDEPAVGLFKDGEMFSTTSYSTMMPGSSYIFQMDLPETMATGDWLLYLLYDYQDFRYRLCKEFPIVDDLGYPSPAALIAPTDGSVVPPGNVEFEWGYSGPVTPTGYELWYGNGSFTQTHDIPWGTDTYTESFTQTAQSYNWYVNPYTENGTFTRTYPQEDPQVWGFSTWNPAPPPADPIDPSGGSASFNGGATGSGTGSTVTITPGSIPPTLPINISQTDPASLGVPYPDNALDIAFTIETDGSIATPLTIRIEWDYPVPTPPTSGAPTLLVNHGGGWYHHLVDAWNFDSPSYWIEFSTDQLSDWVIGDGDDNPLPVTLSAFTGLCFEGIPHLNWTTQSETENLGWNIYRSLSQNGWQENNISQINPEMIPGQGTTAQLTNYTYQDIYDIVEDETYFYWLQSISISGDVEIYGPVSVLVEIEEEPIVIPDLPETTFINNNYPNPFNPITVIEFGIKEGETGNFTIYNLRGQKVLNQKFEEGYHTYHWNAEKQASGIYFYVLKTPSYNQVKRMILLK